MNTPEKINMGRRKAIISGAGTLVLASTIPQPTKADIPTGIYTKKQLRNLNTPSNTSSTNACCFITRESDELEAIKWHWDPTEEHKDDNIKYLLPTNHTGVGRYVLDGEVTYKSFDIFDFSDYPDQDSSDGVKSYWNYCIEHDLSFTLGAIKVLITENNIFGQFGAKTIRRKTIQGVSKNETKIIFRPTSGSSCFLYDGGNGSVHNSSILLNQTFRDLTIFLDASNCASVGAYRLDGHIATGTNQAGANQNFEFQFCTITSEEYNQNKEANAGETFFYELVGNVNTSENKNLFCEINHLTHVCILNNPQGIDQSFIECDVWLIKSHFFVVDGGGLEIRITGGSWIWDDNQDEPQYLFYIPNSAGIGKGNLVATITSFKPEMRSPKAGLVYAPGANIQDLGAIFINFISCNFMGGGLEGLRTMIKLNTNKRVTFTDCAIPYSMKIEFTNIINTGHDTTGFVLFKACGFEEDISGNITLDPASGGGRVIADELCHGIIGKSGGIEKKHAFAFDTNPYDIGRGLPSHSIKRVPIKTNMEPWPYKKEGFRELSVTLPLGSRIVGFKIRKPPTQNPNTYTLNIGDGNNDVYVSSKSEDNKGFIIDWEFTLDKQIVCDEITRVVKIWESNGGFDHYSDKQDVCDVLYI